MRLRIQVDALDDAGHEVYNAHRQMEVDEAQLPDLIAALTVGAEGDFWFGESSDVVYSLIGNLVSAWAASDPANPLPSRLYKPA